VCVYIYISFKDKKKFTMFRDKLSKINKLVPCSYYLNLCNRFRVYLLSEPN